MRKLSYLVIALFAVRYGVLLIAATDPLADYVIRDALIFGVVGLLLFLFHASPLPESALASMTYAWPMIGRFFGALGVGLVLAATIWTAWGGVETETTRQAVFGLWLTGGLVFWVGVLWPGPPTHYRPRFRWELDAAGRYARRVLQGGALAPQSGLAPRLRWALLLIAAGTVIAAGVMRLGQLSELPPACLGGECVRALELAETGRLDTGFFGATASLFFRFSADALLSLRLAAALFALALLPLMYGLGRLYTRGGGAAVAVIVLALSPWHLWAARLSDPWIGVPLFVAWTLWAGSRALQTQSLGWWAAVGMGLGALWVEIPGMGFVILVWTALAAILCLLAGRQLEIGWSARLMRVALLPAGLLVVAAPALARIGLAQADGASLRWTPAAFRHDLGDLLLVLLRPGPLGPETGPGLAFLSPLWGALALLGVAYLARHLHRLPVLYVMSSLAVLVIGLLGVDWHTQGAVGALLPVLPFLFLGIAVAADAVFTTFQRVWRPLVPMPRALATGLIWVAVLGLWQVPAFLGALAQADQRTATSADVAMGQYLAQCLNAPDATLCDHPIHEAPPLIFVPASVLNSPGARLLLGRNLEDDRIRVLDASRDLLPGPLPGDVQTNRGRVYFAPLENQQLLELLQRLYPDADAIAPATDAGPTLFAVFRVGPDLLNANQGLQGAYAQGSAFMVASAADLVRRDGPLDFAWSAEPPLPPPFTVAWEGSLLVAEAGIYEFMVDAPTTGPSLPQSQPEAFLPPLTFQLDDRLVLDTSLGLTEQRIALAQGSYRLRLYLRAELPSQTFSGTGLPDFTLYWRPPGQDFRPIPRHALYSPPLPQLGLLGTYYAGSEWLGPTLTQRKDLLLEPEVDLPQPYSVRWEGRLGATRAGEYLFAVSGTGYTQLLVDGRFVLDYAPGRDLASDPGFVQAGIYLTRGWRQIEIRHAPDATRPSLRILWQPPGSGPELLRSRYLLPLLGEVASGEVTLPSLPELWDARLGDDMFALTYMVGTYLQEADTRFVALPPATLPNLPLTQAWSFAACGSGAGQLSAPHGAAIDALARRVYVADTGNRRVAVFDLDTGAPLAMYAGPGFEEPTDVAVWLPNAWTDDEERSDGGQIGEIFVLDAVGHPISRLDPLGDTVEPLSLQTSFYRPRGFTLDENGVFWVADTGGARVAAIDADGQLLTQVGGHGSALGRGQPVDVIAVNGVRWAVSAEDGRLWNLESSGTIPAIQRINTIDGPHLAGLPNGSFFLSDPASRSLTLHAPSGEPLRRADLSGALVHPTGVAATHQGDHVAVAVVDTSACGLSLWHMVVAD